MQDPTIEDKVLGALRELAGVVGETAETLWPMAVEATWAQGVTNIAIAALLATVACVGAYLIKRNWKGLCEHDNEAAVCVPAVFISIIFLIFGGLLLSNGLPRLLAPEGMTLLELLK